MYKQDLALNNLQGLMYHKAQKKPQPSSDFSFLTDIKFFL